MAQTEMASTAAALRLILASGSPARLATLRGAGLAPEVVVSGVDETAIAAESAGELAGRLAELKAAAVFAALGHLPADQHRNGASMVIIGCDSVLELDGEVHGKPGTAEVAIERWHRMQGRSGVLHTGHHVIVADGAQTWQQTRTAATTVHFADLSDAEIDAYVATGEPLDVAGAFTLDGLGGPFVTGVEGDPHNVVGISLPLLRNMLIDAGIPWPLLWTRLKSNPHRPRP